MPWEFKNGNYVVRIENDGTKTRIGQEPFLPEYPESMDIKITNKCANMCAFCHENSVPDGKSWDVDKALKLLSPLPKGVEFALGGGNPVERILDIKWLNRNMCYGNIFNMTVNSRNLQEMEPYGLGGFQALGISYNKADHAKIKTFLDKKKEYSTAARNAVIHMIAGVHSVDDLVMVLGDFDKVLILGYKNFGRGKKFKSPSVETCLKEWQSKIGSVLNLFPNKVIAFDNLALELLDVQRFFTKERWDGMYMGNEGQFSMYLDLVEEKYAVNSTAEERYPIGDKTIAEMFAHVKSLAR